jgi:hypothetical protein
VLQQTESSSLQEWRLLLKGTMRTSRRKLISLTSNVAEAHCRRHCRSQQHRMLSCCGKGGGNTAAMSVDGRLPSLMFCTAMYATLGWIITRLHRCSPVCVCCCAPAAKLSVSPRSVLRLLRCQPAACTPTGSTHSGPAGRASHRWSSQSLQRTSSFDANCHALALAAAAGGLLDVDVT